MKKYLAATAVAVMVFAFSAFAAQFTVNAGVLQWGSDTNLTCTENVNVSFSVHEGDAGGVLGQSGWRDVILTGLDGCEGTTAYVRVFDETREIWRSSATDTVTGDSLTIRISTGQYRNGYTFPSNLIGTADIERVDVLIRN